MSQGDMRVRNGQRPDGWGRKRKRAQEEHSDLPREQLEGPVGNVIVADILSGASSLDTLGTGEGLLLLLRGF